MEYGFRGRQPAPKASPAAVPDRKVRSASGSTVCLAYRHAHPACCAQHAFPHLRSKHLVRSSIPLCSPIHCVTSFPKRSARPTLWKQLQRRKLNGLCPKETERGPSTGTTDPRFTRTGHSLPRHTGPTKHNVWLWALLLSVSLDVATGDDLFRRNVLVNRSRKSQIAQQATILKITSPHAHRIVVQW